MSRLAPVVLAGLVLSGCTTWAVFRAPARLLADADGATERGDFERALREYDSYLARYPDDWPAPRVRMTRDAVVAVVASRTELAKLRRELAARDSELARLRDELARLRDELARVNSDLERIKEIDLKHERPR